MNTDLISKDDLLEPYVILKDLKYKQFENFQSYKKDMKNNIEVLNALDRDLNFNQLLAYSNALANKIRLKILHFLMLVDVTCFCELERVFNLNKSTLNYHIKLLHDSNLIETTKNGKLVTIKRSHDFYDLIPDHLKQSFEINIGTSS